MSDHTCADCETRWSHAPSPSLKAAGWAVVAVAVAAMVAMLALIHAGQTGYGGGAAVVAMAGLGLGMKLTSKTIARCPSCGATPVAS